MRNSADNYSYLIQKIDEFIRKYYFNQLVRGCLYLAASFLASYILIALAEYFGNFSILVRTLLFYGFLLLNGLILIKWIVIPLLSYYRLGSRISHEQASEIIGRHFTHVKDKLLNTLQLKKLADNTLHQKDLIEASINQKISDLKPVPFSAAIRIKENRKYLKYVVPPLALIVLIGASAPSMLTDSTFRLIKHNEKFVKKAPFQFVVLNRNMSAIQGDDFELKVKMTGTEIPQEIYLEDGINSFKLEKDNIITFRHTFKNLQSTRQIRLIAGEFASEPYVIEVKKRPSLLSFKVALEYPAYLHKKNEVLENTGELSVPVGTRLSWSFKAQNSNSLLLEREKTISRLLPAGLNTFKFVHRAMTDMEFSLKPSNGEAETRESSVYKLTVIPDLAPQIQVNERPDSVNRKMLYFVGQLSDDHGFSSLRFHYRAVNQNGSASVSRAVSFDRNAIQSNFFYVWDLTGSGIKPGQQVEYYFEIFDNDAVHGPKSSRTPAKLLRLPSQEELENKLERSGKAVEKKIEEAGRQASQLDRDAKKLNQDLINKRNLSFEEKKQIERLLEKRNDLEKLIDEIRKDNTQNQADRQDLREQDQKVLEKQKQIENLLDNVLDEKTREILKNIQKLLEQNNKNQTQQQLSEMQADNKNVQKELDRILELYKQLEFDQKLEDAVDKLNKLAQKQEQLQQQTLQNKNLEEAKNSQAELNKQFDEVRQDLKELEQKNNELENKNDYQNPEEQQQQIEQQLEQSSRNLQNKNSSKAAENQQKAARQMKQLSKELEQMQEENEQQEVQISLQSLRQILKNLLSASFDQEKLMQELRSTSPNDPNYNRRIEKQRDIKENLKLVEDSLIALGKKAPQIESVVNKEIQTINKNVQSALSNLADRRTAEANRDQRYAMTSINNLAVMLSEVEEQLQRMMQNAQQSGKGNKKSLSQLRQMQEQLNSNMQKARQQMQQQGNKPGQGQPKGQMSEQLAKMAREQAMIRQALQEINRELNKDGKARLGNLEKLGKEMEQSETDLVHKKIQQETLIRQQEILSKLLEAEKADRERELDKKRESKEGKGQSSSYKIVLDEFKKLKRSEVELLKTVPPSLNSFYKLKVGDYFRLLNSK